MTKKNLLTLMVVTIIPFFAMAQTLSLKAPKNALGIKKVDTIVLKEPEKDDETVYLMFQVSNRKAGTTMKFKLNDANNGTADKGKDYEYPDGALSEKTIDDKSPDYFSVPVTIKADKIDEVNEDFSISILYDDNSGTPVVNVLTVIITDARDPSKKVTLADTAQWSFKIVTAGNFDFFTGATFKNYVGDLNLFVPAIWTIKHSYLSKDSKGKLIEVPDDIKVGFQFGIFNYKYDEADSSNSNVMNEMYKLKPDYAPIVPGTTKYVHDIYALNSKIDYNIWGLYLNPMVTLSNSDWANIYFNLHAEVLIRTQTTTYSKVPLRKDTAVVNTVTGPTALGEFPGFRGLYDKKTFYDTYFGVGFPVKLDFKKKMAFSISPTFGISSYAFSSFATNPNNPALRYIAYTRELSPFFLCKGQLSTSVAPVDIVLGGEYRSVIGKNNYLTLYLGASIAIDKLKR